MDQYSQLDTFVTQVVTNTTFLKKFVFGRAVAMAAVVVFGFFLVAAIVTK